MVRSKGRPSQDKVMRPYTLDKEIVRFIDSLPDGERSRFVNGILVQGIELENLSGRFYNYLLMRPDGTVFYVGKGQGDRINSHERDARSGVVSHKCNVIRKIWEDGGAVIKQKIAFFESEEDAFQLEILLITFFGRENLTNCTDGGEGTGRPLQGEGSERVGLTLSKEVVAALRRMPAGDRSKFIDDVLKQHPRIIALMRP